MNFEKMAQENKILEVRVGSHLFGTDTADSDLDLYGIFMPSKEIVFGFQKCENIKLDQVAKDETGRNTKDAIDYTLTEYRKYIKLALENNPNILHILFVDNKNVRYIDEFGERLLDMADKFPYKGAHYRFIKYAEAQKHKMRIKPEKYNELKAGLSILNKFSDHQVMADVIASKYNHCRIDNRVDKCAIDIFKERQNNKHIVCGDLQLERGVFVSKAKKIIQKRLDKFTHRSSLYETYGYDVKFGSNLIHLLMESIELMNTGRIKYPLDYRQDILDIKNGKYTLNEILEWSEDLEEKSKQAYEKSSLRTDPNFEEIENFTIKEMRDWFRS